MNQNIWGSSMWFSLHTITMNYPDQPTYVEQKDYKNFFISLQYVIPCKVCKRNYQRHLKEHPIDNHLQSKKKLVYWLIDIHNMVNAEIGKKILSYDKVIEKYETIYDKKIFNDEFNETEIITKINHFKFVNVLIIIIIILIIILLSIYLLKFS